jgi:hypothetical protein
MQGTLSFPHPIPFNPGIMRPLLLCALVMAAFGCMAGYGTISPNANAKVLLADPENLHQYTLYVYGDLDNPTALAGLTGGYRMTSRTWKQVPPGLLQPYQLTAWRKRRGYDILSPNGQAVGMMVSTISTNTVKVDDREKTVELIPHARVGGGN